MGRSTPIPKQYLLAAYLIESTEHSPRGGATREDSANSFASSLSLGLRCRSYKAFILPHHLLITTSPFHLSTVTLLHVTQPLSCTNSTWTSHRGVRTPSTIPPPRDTNLKAIPQRGSARSEYCPRRLRRMMPELRELTTIDLPNKATRSEFLCLR